MNLSLVVPVYNEEENLPLLYEAVLQTIVPLQQSWELVLVDDGSRDGSLRVLEELAARDPEHVRVVQLRRNFGQTAAIAAGCIPVTEPNFNYTPAQPIVGQMITFTGETAVATPPVNYTWNFGDSSPMATGQIVTHTFPLATAALPYSVVMTATNACSVESVPKIITVGLHTLYLPLVFRQ